MAGDWIKMRVNLQTHPKVVRILSATHADKFRVLGGLHAVWSVFDTHSTDGILIGYTPETLDHIIGWDGFSAALIAVGWLAAEEETLILPEFTEHNGQSAKRRAEDQKRKKQVRNRPDSVRIDCGQDADKMRTREEKRREEKKEQKTAPNGVDLLAGIDKQVASDFKALRTKLRAPITSTAMAGIQREAEKAGVSVQEALRVCCERGWRGFKAEWLEKKGANGYSSGSSNSPAASRRL